MTENQKYDLTVLGSGPGGYVAAIRAAQLGMKVAVVERENIGGICLNWGCIPTKALLKSAEVLNTIKKSNSFGIKTGEIEIDFPAIIKRSRQIASRLSKGVGFLLKKNNIEVFNGTGRFKNMHTIAVSNAEAEEIVSIQSNKFLLATGARPRNLPGLELDEEKLISYRQAMTLSTQPKSMIIIGAGAIGVEFAYFYNTIGTDVILIEMMPQILPLEDTEIVDIVHKKLKKDRIKVFTDTKVQRIEKSAEGVKAFGSTPAGDESWEADLCLVAIGVQANSDGIGLEDVGIVIEKGFVKVDDVYCTSAENIWAIGDLIGAPMLAHAASHEGIAAVENMAGLSTHKVEPDKVPSCTYCQPQVASVGLTEKQALERGYKIKVGRFPVVASSRAVASGERDGLIKLIFDEAGSKLIGAHIVGPEATELIAELGVAQLQPDPFKAITSTIHAHPTLSEAVAEAALDAFGRAIHL